MKTLICKYCGKSYIRQDHGAKYCSRECYHKDSTKCERVCLFCGKIFMADRNLVLKGWAKYCSKLCYNKDIKRVDRICETCGSTFCVVESVVKIGHGRFCSLTCARIACNGKEKNGRWRGGISEVKYCRKFNNVTKERVRTKFNRKCIVCGISENGKHHHVHHVDYNKLQGCNGKEWALVPLCHSCHSKTNAHRWYWFNLLINYWALNEAVIFGDFLNGIK